MLLATRCPFCETVFRILPAQLTVRRGLVRCGHCQEAFDASGSLYEVPEGGDFANAVPVTADVAAGLTGSVHTAAPHLPETGQPATPPASPPDFGNPAWDPWAPRADSRIDERLLYSADQLPSAGRAPGVTPTVTAEAAEPHFAPEATAAAAVNPPKPGHIEPTLSAHEATPPLNDPEPVMTDAGATAAAAGATAAAAAAASATPAFSALSPDEGREPFTVTREAPARAPRRTGWRIVGVLLALVFLALLAAQLAWWLRETVMVYWPGSQPIYVQVCKQLGCQITPPRDIDGLQVLPSALRQVDDPHHLELKVPLRNHFNVALAYPAMELTLLDPQNNIVVRRVLTPQDYAKPGTRIEDGLPAHSTQTMIVRLDTGNVTASNFRIEIFYP